MRCRTAVVLLVFAPLTVAFAQTSVGDERAFVALRASHIGSLTPLMTPAMISRRLNSAQLAIRYGFLDEGGIRSHAIAASAILTAGLQSSMTLTAGVRDDDCTGCTPALLLGAGGDMRVIELGDPLGAGSALNIAVSGEVGYAQLNPGSEHALTLGIGAPITLSLANIGTTQMRIAPYLMPMFGIGQTSGPCSPSGTGCDKNGTRWVIGGGVGVWNAATNISAAIGVNQIVLSGAKPVYGINVILGGR